MMTYALLLLSASLGAQSPIRDLVSQLDGASGEVERSLLSDLVEFGPMGCHEELDPELAEFGVPAIVARIVSPDEELAVFAIRMLGQLSTQAHGAKGPLRRALDDDRRAVRIAAAQALSRISAVDGELILPVLMDAVSTPTVELLVDFPYIGHQTAPAVPAIARLLEQSDVQMASLAAELLKNLGPIAERASPQLVTATRHSDVDVRWPSLEALAQCGCVPPSFLKEAERLAEEDTDHRVRQAATVVAWFARNSGGAPLDNLLESLKADDPHVRKSGVLGLRHFWSTSDTARNSLRQAVDDPNPDVWNTAWQVVTCGYE